MLTDPNLQCGSVVLRGIEINLDSDVGCGFIVDCCRYCEGLLTEDQIKTKLCGLQSLQGLRRHPRRLSAASSAGVVSGAGLSRSVGWAFECAAVAITSIHATWPVFYRMN
jgi:hypothetical protein